MLLRHFKREIREPLNAYEKYCSSSLTGNGYHTWDNLWDIPMKDVAMFKALKGSMTTDSTGRIQMRS